MNDDERVRHAVKKDGCMYGPLERERCQKHPRRWTTYRWVWTVGGDISAATPEVVRSCAECLEDDRHQEDE